MLNNEVQKLLPEGIFLLDLKENLRGSSVRMTIDTVGGMDLSTTSEVAKLVNESGVLDSAFPKGCRLEVSSPGITTPLTQPFQYHQHVGKKIKIVVSIDSIKREFNGILQSATDEQIELKLFNGEQISLDQTDIDHAVVQVSFE